MSVFYEVNEHLLVTDTEKHREIADLARSQLCLLGAWMLRDRANFFELTAIADDTEYHFTGNTMNEDYHRLIHALDSARSLEIISSYSYSCSALSPDPGPFPMAALLQEIAQNHPEDLRGMFYSMYNNADCADDAGTIVAYGEKGARFYTGHVPFHSVDAIPDGDWYTPVTAVVFESDRTDGKDMDAIEAVCRQMCEFSSMDDLARTGDGGIRFFLNNLRIRNNTQLQVFLGLLMQLISLTGGDCGLIGELADISGPDVRLLHFDVEASGRICLDMASVSD